MPPLADSPEPPLDPRVTMLPTRDTGLLGQLYGLEWSQHLFLYENIQSLDVVQMAGAGTRPECLVDHRACHGHESAGAGGGGEFSQKLTA